MPKKPRRSKPNATGRNVDVRFVKLDHWMLKSPAWRTLPPNAKAVLIEVWRLHNGANNGSIAYAVRDAEEIGLSKDQASRAFKELQDRGFLRLRRDSCFSVKSKESRLWEITAEPCGDAQATKEFMQWGRAKAFEAAPEKIKTQSHQRDTQSHQRDREAKTETKLPISVSPARPSPPISAPSRSHQRDTYIYHGGSNNLADVRQQQREPAHRPEDRHGAAVRRPRGSAEPDTVTPLADASDHRNDGPVSPAQRSAAERPGGSGIERDRAAIDMDLERLLAATGGRVGSGVAPRDALRDDLDAYLKKSARGETAKLAAKIGLSRPQLANFRYGTYSLNPAAARVLRTILDTEGAPT